MKPIIQLILLSLAGYYVSADPLFSEYNKIPKCPGEKVPKTDKMGNVFVCLPGRQACPEDGVCWFNGFDYLCCPMEKEPVNPSPLESSFEVPSVPYVPASPAPPLALLAKQALFRKTKFRGREPGSNVGRHIVFSPRRNSVARRVEVPTPLKPAQKTVLASSRNINLHSASSPEIHGKPRIRVQPPAVTVQTVETATKKLTPATVRTVETATKKLTPATTTETPEATVASHPDKKVEDKQTEPEPGLTDQIDTQRRTAETAESKSAWEIPTTFVDVNAPSDVRPTKLDLPSEPVLKEAETRESWNPPTTFVDTEMDKSPEMTDINLRKEGVGVMSAKLGRNLPTQERLERERYMRYHFRNGYPYNDMYYYPRDQLPDYMNPYIIRDPSLLQDAPSDGQFHPTAADRAPSRQRPNVRYNYNYARWMTRYGTRWY